MSESITSGWDHEVDVLVVGTGAGAMTAALKAHDQGGRVLLIEKSSQYGGSSAMSSCLLWVPNNHLMPGVGIDDSPEESIEYLRGTTAGVVPEERLLAYRDKGPEMLRYLTDETRVELIGLPEYPDYYPAVKGSKPGGRSVEPAHFDARVLGEDFLNLRSQNLQMQVIGRLGMTAVEARQVLTGQPGGMLLFAKLVLKYILDIPWRFRSRRDRNPSGGNALIGMLRLSLRDRDVPLWLDTPARELVIEDGRVVGIVAEKEGQPFRIRATRGVILGAGGFEGNQAMREKYLPNPTRAEWTCGNPDNTGDIIEMGLDAGAAVDLMDDAWWGPTSVVPGEDIARMLVIEKSLPGSILVSKAGRRFVNEAAPYIDIVNSMYATHTPENPCVPAYFVFDATYRQKYMCGPIMQGSASPDWMVKKFFSEGYLKRANTIEELAGQLGVDAEGLRDSVARNNEYAKTGKDPEFNRGDNIYDRYYGDSQVEPNPCIGPIEKAPFYAIEAFAGELGTKGGLAVDEQARVLHTSGQAIPGLYAIGNCSSAVMGRSYPGAGATIGPACAFGYVAAMDAMKGS
ncbi:MAG: FAD-binding protein [Deltaproteobacteria bacterium]|nr:FAD-binding protein [Deltaproteobacteria bacterium]MBW2420927.1 FAD-binding protein [Deltaproteobacteria bacterium]